MSLYVTILTAIIGLIFGSFLNVCISRLPRHESIVSPRSRCPRCQRPIPALENIPILSWLLLCGRCRGCREPISWRYPLIEIVTALLFLLCRFTYGITVPGIGAMVLCFLLLGLAVTDAETLTLPNTLTYPGIVLGVIYAAVSANTDLPGRFIHAGYAILWGIIFAAIILFIRWFYLKVRHVEGLGIGDAKLLAMIAVWMGPLLSAEVFFFGVFAAAIYGMVLLALRSPRGLQTQLPLGAFLCASGLVMLFQGEKILKWYFHFYR